MIEISIGLVICLSIYYVGFEAIMNGTFSVIILIALGSVLLSVFYNIGKFVLDKIN